jgi:3-hydroxybutyryl-CoA dehydrogenase
MQIVVIATIGSQKEFTEKGIPEGIEVHFETTVANTKAGDVYFYLLPEEELLKDAPALAVLNKPVFANAVITTFEQLPQTFIRINAWPGFLQRSIIEVATNGNNLEAAEKTLQALNWKFQPVADIPGMITARTIAMIINEAYFALEDEVSTKAAIDIAMKLGTNYPLGPFEWSQEIGLKKVYDLLLCLSKADLRYTPSALLTKEITT